MIEVSYEKALAIYSSLPEAIKAPAFHPQYIVTDAMRNSELQPRFLLYKEENRQYFHAVHYSRVPILGTSFHDVQSPYGYGGPLSNSDDPSFLERAWEAYSKWCRNNRVIAEFIRFHPLIENERFFSGETFVDRETVWLDLRSNQEIGYRTLTKRKLKKALQYGVEAVQCTENEFQGFFPALYNALMEELGTTRFYFFPEDYLKAMAKWDHAFLIACKNDERVVAAGVFLIDSDVAEYHLGTSTLEGKELGAMYLLMHSAAMHARGLGALKLHLGGGTSGVNEDPLLFFKSGFSKNRALFKIGKKIHDPVTYSLLREEWLNKHGEVSSKILFYRF